nr:hypothetical protein [Stenotrophomonas geniculata]
MSVIEEIRAEMSRGTPLSSMEAKQLLVKLAPELGHVKERWSAIAIAGARSLRHGPVYQKALTSGTHEEVAELQKEFDRLCVDQDRMKAIYDTLSRIRQEMAIKEASEALPSLQEKLEASIAQAEDTQKALERSFDALQEAYVAVFQARGLALHGGLPAAGAKSDVVRRLIALSPLSQQNRSALAWRPDVHVDNLGVSRDEASDAARLESQA